MAPEPSQWSGIAPAGDAVRIAPDVEEVNSSPRRRAGPDVEVPRQFDEDNAILAADAHAGARANVSDASLGASLDTLVRLIERVAPGMHASVLLLDDDGVTLRHGAAPNLPEAYCRLIDG
jgi:hypothetical protein